MLPIAVPVCVAPCRVPQNTGTLVPSNTGRWFGPGVAIVSSLPDIRNIGPFCCAIDEGLKAAQAAKNVRLERSDRGDARVATGHQRPTTALRMTGSADPAGVDASHVRPRDRVLL